MMKVIKWIWQLPQNILGLLVILFSRAYYCAIGIWYSDKYVFGVSLGNYIIMGGSLQETRVNHERGHQKQSLYLGPLYLLIIGLPSITGNIFDRIAHKKWSVEKRIDWYYAQPWEKWADKLGGVERNKKRSL